MNVFRKAFQQWFSLGMVLVLSVMAACAQAGMTSLSMQSDTGDYIGQGQVYYYSDADGSFYAQSDYAGGVNLGFNSPGYEHWWYLDFMAADSQPLAVGTYQGAVRYPFQGIGQAGMAVYGDGRGCNTLTGSFTVLQLDRDQDGNVTAFWATFEQHCEGALPALRGEIRYNADVIIDLQAPAMQSVLAGQALDFTVTATDPQNRPITLSAADLPSGAGFTDLGGGTGSFSFTPDPSQVGEYLVAFHADNGAGDTQTAYTLVKVLPAAPENDHIENAIEITSLPYSDYQEVTSATADNDDPVCIGPESGSVWYRFTPDRDMYINAETSGSDYSNRLSIYSGSIGALTEVGCGNGSLQQVQLHAGVTYHLLIIADAWEQSEKHLNLSVYEVPAPLPPLELDVSIDKMGSFQAKSGTATIRGHVDCSKQSLVMVSLYITQGRGKNSVSTGAGSDWLPCDGSKEWTVSIPAPPRLRGGMVTVYYDVYGVTPDYMESSQPVSGTAKLRLRGGR